MFARFPVYLRDARPPNSTRRRPAVLALETDIDLPTPSDADAPVAIVVRDRARDTLWGKVVETQFRLYDGRLFARSNLAAKRLVAELLPDPFRPGGPGRSFVDHVRRLEHPSAPWPDGIGKLFRNEGGWDEARNKCYRLSAKFVLDDANERDVALWKRSFEIACGRFLILGHDVWTQVPEPRLALSTDDVRINVVWDNIYDDIPGSRVTTHHDKAHMFSLLDMDRAVSMARELAAEKGQAFDPLSRPDIVINDASAVTTDFDLVETKRFAARIVALTSKRGFFEEDGIFWPVSEALSRIVEEDTPISPEDLDEALHAFIEASRAYVAEGANRPVFENLDPAYVDFCMKRWNERPIGTKFDPKPPAPPLG